MAVRRVVPDLAVADLARGRAFYETLLGVRTVMDHGWIATLADDPAGPQLSLATADQTAPVVPDLSVEVDDLDAAWAAAQRLGADVVHPLTDEPWGVRRFFVRDPDGHVVNVLSHRPGR